MSDDISSLLQQLRLDDSVSSAEKITSSLALGGANQAVFCSSYGFELIMEKLFVAESGLKEYLQILCLALRSNDANCTYFRQGTGIDMLKQCLDTHSSTEGFIDTLLECLIEEDGRIDNTVCAEILTLYLLETKPAQLQVLVKAVHESLSKYPYSVALFNHVGLAKHVHHLSVKALDEELSASEKLLAPLVEHFNQYGVDPSVVAGLLKKADKPEHAEKLSQWTSDLAIQPSHFYLGPESHFEFRKLHKRFPPASGEYSISVWVKIEKNTSSTIIDIYDFQQSLIKASVKADGKRSSLHIQWGNYTHSVKGDVPGGRWTLVTLVYEKNKIYCYLDSVIQDTVSVAARPIQKNTVSVRIGGDRQDQTNGSIRIGSLLITDTAIIDQTVSFLHYLGPSYYGSYQDNMSKFLTYEGASLLELERNDNDASSSVTSHSLPGPPSLSVPQHSIILTCNPHYSTDLNCSLKTLVVNTIDDKQSDQKSKEYMGIMEGEAYVVTTSPVDKAIYPYGGLHVLLQLVENASTPEQLMTALRIFCSTLQSSWKMSDEAEHKEGYSILAMILKAKGEIIGVRHLIILLDFVGYVAESPDDSIIINPMAYLALILEFDIWKGSSAQTLKLLLHQFVVFCTSREHDFNVTRLVKMRVMKTFLQAVKADAFPTDIYSDLCKTLTAIICANYSSEVMRSITLFITFALSDSISVKQVLPYNRLGLPLPEHKAVTNSRREQGMVVLEAFVRSACQVDVTQFARKLSRTVTIKWFLSLLDDQNPEVVVNGLHLLSLVLSSRGPAFKKKFIRATRGITLMTAQLGRWWPVSEVWILGLSLLFGLPFTPETLKCPLPEYFQQLYHANAIINVPEAILVLNEMIVFACETYCQLESGSEDCKNVEEFIYDVVSSYDELRLSNGDFCKLTTFRVYLDGSCRMTYALFKDENNKLTNKTGRLHDLMKAHLRNILLDLLWSRRDFGEFWDSVGPEGNHVINTLCGEDLLAAIVDCESSVLFEPRCFTNAGQFLSQYSKFHIETGAATEKIELLFTSIGSILARLSNVHGFSKLSKALYQTKSSLVRIYVALTFRCLITASTARAGNSILRQVIKYQNFLLADVRDSRVLGDLITQVYRLLTIPNIDQRYLFDFLRAVFVVRTDDVPSACHQFSRSHGGEICSFLSELAVMTNDEAIGWVAEVRPDFDSYILPTVYERGKELLASEEPVSELKLDVLGTHHAMESMVYQTYRNNIVNWQLSILDSEKVKFHRNIQDKHEHYQMLLDQHARVDAEAGRLNGSSNVTSWRLDLSEGRIRMHKKVVPDESEWIQGYMDRHLIDGEDTELDKEGEVGKDVAAVPSVTAAGSVGSALVDESASLSSSLDEESFEVIDDFNHIDDSPVEDKNRKVIRMLEPGDTIVDFWNVGRIVGVEATEGLLILGAFNLYVVDKYFHRSDGEVVNASEAPVEERDPFLRTIAGGDKNGVAEPVAPQSGSAASLALKFPLESILQVTKRRFLLRDVAIEIFFTNGCSLLLTAATPRVRDAISNKLLNNRSTRAMGDAMRAKLKNDDILYAISHACDLDSASKSFSQKLGFSKSSSAAHIPTKKWMAGELSNFSYLMILNTLAGRTFNDITQYPIFPWVLADYDSDELDFSKPETFRDLSKPMGAQSPLRAKEFKSRYEALLELDDTLSPPFHYGTHYSSAMIVTSYLIRLQPFVHSYLLLQGGRFDHADRLFYSIKKAWLSASRDNTTDVRELIPEFFFLPEFLSNSNNFSFGQRQNDGDAKVNDVELPPWAKGDPKLFVQRNREALESQYVRDNLHLWIDLIFGVRQQGSEAIESLNVFHHLSYRGAINLEVIENEMEKLATIGIIHNFGQTPAQILTKPHPKSGDVEATTWDLAMEPDFTVNTNEPEVIEDLFVHNSQLKVTYRQRAVVTVEGFPPTVLRADGRNHGLQVWNDNKLITVFEGLHLSPIELVVALENMLVLTADRAGLVSVHRLIITKNGKSLQYELSHLDTLRGHEARISHIRVSECFNYIITLDHVGKVIQWDLSTFKFIRTFTTEGVRNVQVNEVTGDIALLTSDSIVVTTINDDHLVTQQLNSTGRPANYCAAFISDPTYKWHGDYFVVVGDDRGEIITFKLTHNDKWNLEKLSTRTTTSHGRINALLLHAPSTSLYAGDNAGNIYRWGEK
ncbi:Beige protein-like protein 1 [Yarrowia sp. C11]|nr:Beige protein-like protein 1 [Yarrowia sp. C11]